MNEFAHLRKRIYDKGISIVLTIKIRLNKIQDTVVTKRAPLDIDDNLDEN